MAPNTFARARNVVYVVVVGSRVKEALGRDILSFSGRKEAREFMETLRAFKEIIWQQVIQ